MDSQGYLKRFFDIQLKFPFQDNESFIRHHLKRNIPLNSTLIKLDSIDSLINNISHFSIIANLSLRDIEKFTLQLKILLASSLHDYDIAVDENNYAENFKKFSLFTDDSYDMRMALEEFAKFQSDVLFTYYYIIVIQNKYPRLWSFIISNPNSLQVDKALYLSEEEKAIFELNLPLGPSLFDINNALNLAYTRPVMEKRSILSKQKKSGIYYPILFLDLSSSETLQQVLENQLSLISERSN